MNTNVVKHNFKRVSTRRRKGQTFKGRNKTKVARRAHAFALQGRQRGLVDDGIVQADADGVHAIHLANGMTIHCQGKWAGGNWIHLVLQPGKRA